MQPTRKYFFVLLLLSLLMTGVCAIPVTVYITESGDWVCPTNVFVGQITVTAPGGGGMGGNATHVGYSGYNGSTVYLTDYPLVPGQRYPIVIGNGGRATPGYSTSPVFAGPSVAYSATPHYWETSNGEVTTTAFGVTPVAGTGASLLMETFSKGYAVNGWTGYGSYIQTLPGGDGFGSLTYSLGGLSGVGFGAGGPGGGMGGVGGTGGNGVPGANGGVTITYDTDSSENMVSGSTYNAQTGAVLPTTTILFSQGQLSFSVTSDGSGLFTVPASTGLKTGYTVTETVSKTGYYTETFTFIPYVSQIIPQRLSLIPTTFNRGANGTISGIIRDQYGSSIGTVDVSMTSTTGSTLSMTSTSAGMYYFTGVPALTTWDATFTKTGYANVTSVFDMGKW